MNQDQIGGVVRAVVQAVGAGAVTGGLLTGDQLAVIGGAVAAIAGVVWSIFSNRTGKVNGAPKQ